MQRFGAPAPESAPDPDDVGERHVLLRIWRRVRVFLVLVPLLIALLVAASIGARKLFEDVPVRAVDPDVTCWDNTTAKASECTEPTGKAGLRWVFPSYRMSEDQCTRVRFKRSARERPVEFACDLRYDQRPVLITYTVRTSLSQGLSYLQRTYDVVPVTQAGGDRLVFRTNAVDDDGYYSVTVAYSDHPFTVTVASPDAEIRDTALDELVRFRPAGQVVVRGDGGIG